MGKPRVRSVEEAEQHIRSLTVRVEELERELRDHAQRFDTLQTNPFKRAWWWLYDGWPLTDLNAERPNWRPTNPNQEHR